MTWTPEAESALAELDRTMTISGMRTAMQDKFGTTYTHSQLAGKRFRMGLTTPNRITMAKEVDNQRHKIAERLEAPLVPVAPEVHQAPSGDHTCRYIFNDDTKNPEFCPAPKTNDEYCREHWELCHNTTAPRIGWK